MTVTLNSDIIDLRDVLDLLDDPAEDGGDVARAIMAAYVADGICADRDEFEQYTHDEPAMIADSYFEEYARDLAEAVGAVSDDAGWPGRHIDWTAAAEQLKEDYIGVDVVDPDGGETVTFFVRSV